MTDNSIDTVRAAGCWAMRRPTNEVSLITSIHLGAKRGGPEPDRKRDPNPLESSDHPRSTEIYNRHRGATRSAERKFKRQFALALPIIRDDSLFRRGSFLPFLSKSQSTFVKRQPERKIDSEALSQ